MQRSPCIGVLDEHCFRQSDSSDEGEANQAETPRSVKSSLLTVASQSAINFFEQITRQYENNRGIGKIAIQTHVEATKGTKHEIDGKAIANVKVTLEASAFRNK